MTDRGTDNSIYYYSVSLMIEHPSLHPDILTRELQLQPFRQWVAGEDRTAPDGKKLGGRNRLSYWVASDDVGGERFFGSDVNGFMAELERKAVLIKEVASTGGTITISLQLPGWVNIGDVLTHELLGRMATLRVDLSIEVFPNHGGGPTGSRVIAAQPAADEGPSMDT